MLVALAAEMRHVHTVKRLLTFWWEKIGSGEIKARILRFIFAKNQGKLAALFTSVEICGNLCTNTTETICYICYNAVLNRQ